MFEILSEKLHGVFRRLGSKGRLTEKDVDQAMREVRMALLEADVNFKVARNLVSRIRQRALEEELVKTLNPGQQVVKITNEELTEILGGSSRQLEPSSQQPSVILVIGLNGSGKTTTAAKLAWYLRQSAQMSVLVAADLRRPAAIQQLEILGKQVGVPVYQSGSSQSTAAVAKNGVKQASQVGAAWAIVDTGGRFQVDDELMSELEDVKAAVLPTETLLVVDSMTGQDAVRAAQEFHNRIGLTGIVMTKLDGDARGGAALSITSVTGVPIKFIGTGERFEALEQFYPDRLASRILGMGDVMTLIERAQTAVSQQQAAEIEKKMRQATFNLEDFLSQLQQLKRLGPISQLLEMLPGMSAMKSRVSTDELDDGHLQKVEAIIFSMTPSERRRPELIEGSRRRRIAKGSGTTPQEVNQLLNQFRQMQKLMRQMTSGKSWQKMAQTLHQKGNLFGS